MTYFPYVSLAGTCGFYEWFTKYPEDVKFCGGVLKDTDRSDVISRRANLLGIALFYYTV